MPELSEKARQLADHYRTVLRLYQELEELSSALFDAFQDASKANTLNETLTSKMAVVNRIQEESRCIHELKSELNLNEAERDTVKRAEDQLTDVVKRVVENEDKSRFLFERQGVKISRS